MNFSKYLYSFFCIHIFLCVGFLSAQTITTADSFFTTVSEKYASITDYSANLKITTGTGNKTETMQARVLFKKPDLLRLDFSSPTDQTIVYNGSLLTIYLPSYNVVLNQSVDKTGSSGASLATPQGLSLMKRYYTISYETGPTPELLEGSTSEKVIILLLSRRSTSETFRTLRLMVSPDTNLIRRIDAKTVSADQIVFDFTGYAVNQGILDNRFIYDSPASANMFNNFLFSD